MSGRGIIFAAIVLAGFLAVSAAVYTRKRLPRNRVLTLKEVLPVATQWAKKRGVPVQWVMATIQVESHFDPRVVGDGGKSYGLMQVNRLAHALRLYNHGLKDDDLFDPETNIEIGTEIMREFYDRIRAEIKASGKPAPADMGQILRLAYKGPAYVYADLRAGKNPVTVHSWAPDAVANWKAALVSTSRVA